MLNNVVHLLKVNVRTAKIRYDTEKYRPELSKWNGVDLLLFNKSYHGNTETAKKFFVWPSYYICISS